MTYTRTLLALISAVLLVQAQEIARQVPPRRSILRTQHRAGFLARHGSGQRPVDFLANGGRSGTVAWAEIRSD